MSTALPKTDVVIIGMGAAGGMAAYVLTKAGRTVVGIEAGPRLDLDDFQAHLDELNASGTRNWMGAPKVNHEVPTWRPDADSPTQPFPGAPGRMMNAVGGTTIHWGMQSWRFREDDFMVRSTTVARYGEDALPPGSAIADWPLSYDDLEPYYDQAEYLMGVSGQGGANPFEAPRSRDYPMPPLRTFEFGERATEAMAALGYHPFPIPAGVTAEAYNGRPACSYCGFCSGYGCWNNSKSGALVAGIPEAEATGLLEIRPNSRVMRILTDEAGTATGVAYRDEEGVLQEQPAGVVILATYTYENTRMLLLSVSEAFPNGLANNGGQVGKYFMNHTRFNASGFFPGERQQRWAGTAGQGVAMDDFNGDNFDHTGLGFIRGGHASITSGGDGPIAVAGTLPPEVPRWGAAYKQWIHENAGSIGTIAMQFDTLPYEGNFLDLDPEVTDRDGVPVVRVTYSVGDNEVRAGEYFVPKMTEVLERMGATQTWGNALVVRHVDTHAYGGTRMGDDPATSVVDRYGVAHEVPNLVVLGASTFPNPAGYNPTETVWAHSWYAAEHLAENFAAITT